MRKDARFPLLVAVPVLLALLALALPAQAQWKWRDANGRLTVSDLPPPRGTPEKDILQRPETVVPRPPAAAASAASAPATPAAPGAAQDPELQARRQAAEQQKAAEEKAAADRVAAQRAENCQRARSHLAALESGQRVARTNSRGELEVLDDRGRAEETRAARAVIASDCR